MNANPPIESCASSRRCPRGNRVLYRKRFETLFVLRIMRKRALERSSEILDGERKGALARRGGGCPKRLNDQGGKKG